MELKGINNFKPCERFQMNIQILLVWECNWLALACTQIVRPWVSWANS